MSVGKFLSWDLPKGNFCFALRIIKPLIASYNCISYSKIFRDIKN